MALPPEKPKKRKGNPAWVKGVSGNPLGLMPHAELNAAKKLTRDELAEVGGMLVRGNYEELLKLADDPKAPVLRRTLANIIKRANDRGDYAALEMVLNRIVGKVKEDIEINHTNRPQVIVMLPPNSRDAKPIEAVDVTPQPARLDTGNKSGT